MAPHRTTTALTWPIILIRRRRHLRARMMMRRGGMGLKTTSRESPTQAWGAALRATAPCTLQQQEEAKSQKPGRTAHSCASAMTFMTLGSAPCWHCCMFACAHQPPSPPSPSVPSSYPTHLSPPNCSKHSKHPKAFRLGWGNGNAIPVCVGARGALWQAQEWLHLQGLPLHGLCGGVKCTDRPTLLPGGSAWWKQPQNCVCALVMPQWPLLRQWTASNDFCWADWLLSALRTRGAGAVQDAIESPLLLWEWQWGHFI